MFGKAVKKRFCLVESCICVRVFRYFKGNVNEEGERRGVKGINEAGHCRCYKASVFLVGSDVRILLRVKKYSVVC